MLLKWCSCIHFPFVCVCVDLFFFSILFRSIFGTWWCIRRAKRTRLTHNKPSVRQVSLFWKYETDLDGIVQKSVNERTVHLFLSVCVLFFFWSIWQQTATSNARTAALARIQTHSTSHFTVILDVVDWLHQF